MRRSEPAGEGVGDAVYGFGEAVQLGCQFGELNAFQIFGVKLDYLGVKAISNCKLIGGIGNYSNGGSADYLTARYIADIVNAFVFSLQDAIDVCAKLAGVGVQLHFVHTNCAVLGAALTNVQKGYGILLSIFNGVGTAVGFTIAIVLLASIRESIEDNDIPNSFKGSPIVLITSGLMAIAFMGFAGLI